MNELKTEENLSTQNQMTKSLDPKTNIDKTTDVPEELNSSSEIDTIFGIPKDYFIGFFFGLSFNLYSFSFTSCFENNRKRKLGMIWGCLVSFLLILFVCMTFAAFAAYKSQVKKENLIRTSEHKAQFQILTFFEFLFEAFLKCFRKRSCVIISLMTQFKIK